ncbi:MAG: DNA polymerase III subunit delta [Candidatus Dormibacteria bacterium]
MPADSVPGLRIICGEEAFLVDEAARALWRSESAQMQSELDAERLDAPATAAAVAALRQLPFLDPHRLVVIADPVDLAGRRPAQRGARRRPADAQPLVEALLECSRPGGTTRVVLVLHQDLPAQSPLAARGVPVTRFPALRPREVEPWVIQRINREGAIPGLASAQVARHLVRSVGTDLLLLASEVEKVRSYSTVAPLDETALARLCPPQDRGDVFLLADAMVSAGAPERLRLLRLVLAEEDAQMVLASLARQLRTWLMVRELRDQGVGRASAAEIVGDRPWVVEKAWDRVASVPAQRLADALSSLADVDWEAKTGRRPAAQGLEALLLGL